MGGGGGGGEVGHKEHFVGEAVMGPPDSGIEDRDRFEKLAACVTESLDAGQASNAAEAGTRGYLSTLWEFLRTRSAGLPSGHDTDSLGDDLPSARQLSRLLRIPRDRLPGLFKVLRQRVEVCRAAISGRRPVNSWQGAEDP